MGFRLVGQMRVGATAVGLVGALLLSGAPGVAAASAPRIPLGARDVTTSAAGRQLIAAARIRFARAGMPAGALIVVQDSTGYTVAPAGTRFASRHVRLADGTSGIVLDPMTASAPVQAPTKVEAHVSPFLVGSWGNPVAGGCFSRISDTWSYLDHCYQMWKESNDGSSTRDWFALRHFGTAFPNSPWVVNSAFLSSSPTSSSSAQNWWEYSPLNGHTGSCTTETIGITSPVGGISHSLQVCEEWDIAKGNPTVSFALGWYGPGTRSSRGLDYEISIYVAQGGWPQWSLPATTSGSAF